MSREKTDFVTKAHDCWGETVPDWILALASEANASSQTEVAKRIGYSGSLVSSVIKGTYTGDLEGVEEAVRGAFMGYAVDCPVLGEIPKTRCLKEQKMPLTAASSLRTRLYQACRDGCPHSRLSSSLPQGGRSC